MKKALILVDHGSAVKEANHLLEEVAEKIRAHPDSPFDIVEHCHMELCEPTIKNAFRKCVSAGAEDITVHPYFLVPGRHSKSDIPEMVAEAARDFPLVNHRVTEPIGLHDKIIEVVLERALERFPPETSS